MKTLFFMMMFVFLMIPVTSFADDVVPATSEDLETFDVKLAQQQELKEANKGEATQLQNRMQNRERAKVGDAIVSEEDAAMEQNLNQLAKEEAKKLKLKKQNESSESELGETVRERARVREQLRGQEGAGSSAAGAGSMSGIGGAGAGAQMGVPSTQGSQSGQASGQQRSKSGGHR